jgi:polyisoprenoid-binding protein YceI
MRHLGVALALLLTACAVPVQDGGPPHDAVAVTRAAGEQPLAVRPLQLSGAKRFVVVGRRSPLYVSGHDSVLGDHLLSFDRWWAHIEADPPRVVVDIDLTSLRSNESFVESIVRNHLLEVDTYRHASLVGTLAATARADRVVIESVADIHGKQSPLRFTGEIRREGEGYRFLASFDMSRRAFDLAYTPAEPFLDDTFTISVNALATPERVDIQEVD